MDEITVTAETHVAELKGGEISEYDLSPEDFGLPRHDPDDLLGGDASLNARVLRGVLSGTERGAARDITLMNAGATIYVAGKAGTLEEGVRAAERTIDSGAALEALESFVRVTRRQGGLV
jgi:anthranilate phosphoribosyltransferase